ncbi:MAG TPA: hypothetical protein VK400_00840 [Pyrinomonadaceae bacterium]|nr:hypothetical protein [Pyrinomonadaceae bacterium]
MANDLPGDAAGLIAEAENFISVTTASPAHFGLTAAQIADLTNKTGTATNTLSDRNSAENAFRVAVVKLRNTLKELEKLLRQLRQIVQANPATTAEDRAALRLATGESKGGGNVGDALKLAPLLLVEPAGVHIHRVRFFMPSEASGSTKKPPGVLGAKIFMKIDGAAATDLKEYQMIALDTKSPYEYAHSAANAGKTAHYVAVWTTKDEEDSPQSEVFSLVIT